MMLFPAVLMNFPDSKVFLIGEWSIPEIFSLKAMTCPPSWIIEDMHVRNVNRNIQTEIYKFELLFIKHWIQ